MQIVTLLRSASRFSEFRLRSGDIEVEVRRANGAAAEERCGEPPASEVTLEPERAVPHMQHVQHVLHVTQVTPVPPVQAAAEKLPPGLTLVRAPMVGTFYCAAAPGAPPFVAPGSRVAADTTVCIIEVMKLMNTIPAGCAGVVTHVLVKDAGPVEFAQPLIAIDPDA
jgi:acetyl-CoA carboxylase biotin carboxyl carrier protein